MDFRVGISTPPIILLSAIPAESVGDPYLRQVPLPRIPVSRQLRSTQYPKDTFPAKLTVKAQQTTHRAAARLNRPAARLTRQTHVFHQLGNIPVQ